MSKPGARGAYSPFPPTMFNVRERLHSHWDNAKQQFMLVLLCVGMMWAVFMIDWALPNDWVELRDWGIRPRTMSGLASIFAAPFLHVNISHLFANTLPLVILGWILVLSGRVLFVRVCAFTALTSGAGAWIFGRGDLVHEGASGVLFGLLGFLITRGWFARRLIWTLTSIAVGVFYLGVVLSLLRPDPSISWSSHLWGFIGGVGLAWWMYGRREAKNGAALKPSPSRPSDRARR